MRRWLRPLGLKPWDWKTCWKSFDFWLAVVVLVLPLGLLLLPIRAVRVRVRAFRRG